MEETETDAKPVPFDHIVVDAESAAVVGHLVYQEDDAHEVARRMTQYIGRQFGVLKLAQGVA